MINDDNMKWANSIQIIDRTNELYEADALYSFALDELLCMEAHRSGVSFCHIWRSANAFVLGQKDSRLPYAAEAMSWLEASGYQPIVRNSGGAAVPLDTGTVNLSLIFPKDKTVDTHFYDDFERMYALIRRTLAFTGKVVQKGEIQGAFCPGDYDLSIAGQKFCGIAQRRKLNAYTIQAFIIAGGSGYDRTHLVQEFYNRAAIGASIEDYPLVTEDSTSSLEELVELGTNAEHKFVKAVKQTLVNLQGDNTIPTAFQLPEPEEIRALARKMRQRYGLTTQ